MKEQDFWILIEESKIEGKDDDKRFLQSLQDKLTDYPEEEIVEFEVILRQHILMADHYNIMAAQKIIEGFVTDDPYLYFRCWLIAQGKEIYENALEDPDSLAGVVNKNDITDCEGLLYVSTEAFSRKTNREEDERFPRDLCSERGLDYDMPGTPTRGDDWHEDDLPVKCPSLWAKFMN